MDPLHATRLRPEYRLCSLSLAMLLQCTPAIDRLCGCAQALRFDKAGVLGQFLCAAGRRSPLVAHNLMWVLEVESELEEQDPAHPDPYGALVYKGAHGFQGQLPGEDPLPDVAKRMCEQLRAAFTPEGRAFYEAVSTFFERVTAISGELKDVQKDRRKAYIETAVTGMAGEDPFAEARGVRTVIAERSPENI